MLIHWIWLAELPEVSSRQKAQLMQYFSDAEELFHAGKAELEGLPGMDPQLIKALANKDISGAETILRKCAQKHISVLTFRDAGYPSRLRNIVDPPLVLYYKGALPDFESQPVIAVVGTRRATPYGLTATKKLSRQIASCGGLVISGGASGIDTEAMRGALETGSKVVGVLGCGVDVVYPRTNRALFAATEESGCLLSEYPPGSRPERWHFPQRNRILSGIANGVLVIEAPQSSGALITARSALEQGRDVFSVPGNIDVATCVGSNALLQDGATAVLSGWDVMKEYEVLYPGKVENRPVTILQPEIGATLAKVAQSAIQNKETYQGDSDKKGIDKPLRTPYSGIDIEQSDLSEQEQKILAGLDTKPRPVDEVIAQVGLPAGKVLSMLTKLALKGVVINHPGRLVSANIRIK